MDLEHEKRLTEVESRSKSNTKRLDDVEKRQDNLDKLVVSVEKLALKEQNVENDVKEIKKDVKEMKDQPGKMWHGIVEKAIYTAVGAIITYFLIRLGIN